MPTDRRIGRLAFREEGDNWNAYYMLPDTPKDAIYLGSIILSAIVRNPHLKGRFMNLMRTLVADIIEDLTGERPTWKNPEPAPESERGGNS